MKKHITLFFITTFLISNTVCFAGLRSEGRYSGVPIFDRWDGCVLYSGIYLMYVSENTKESLRQYNGQAIEINAEDVNQPQNPGDGLIKKLEVLGPAPENRNWVQLKGLKLTSSVKVSKNGNPVASIIMENVSEEILELFSQELALTLLTKRPNLKNEYERLWYVSDGPSFALITRQSFEVGGSEARWQGKGSILEKPYSWSIGEENALPHSFTLGPQEKKR